MLVQNLDKLIQLLKQFQIYRRIPDWFWSGKILEAYLSFHKLDYDKNTKKLLIKPFNFLLSQEQKQYYFLLKEKNVRLAQILSREFNSNFKTNKKRELLISLDGITAIIKCEQDLEIIYEIFVQGVYNFIYEQPLVVIDIGMNTGWASLYFALRDNVKAIYSFEPFQKTYQEALDNFNLNPKVNQKIYPFNYGLSGKEEKINVEYDYERKASIGVKGISTNLVKNQKKSFQIEEIFIKSANEVLAPILTQYPDIDFMAKIDCEGSEYEILESLEKSNLLTRFKIIIMEWHDKGPEQLIEYLSKANFTIFSRRPKSKTIGMIYAVRC